MPAKILYAFQLTETNKLMQSFDSLIGKDLQGKKVVVRIDLNSSLAAGVLPVARIFFQNTDAILSLSKKGASVILLSHQGTPGSKDFISLKQHAKLLSKKLRKKVKFVDDFLGSKATKAINTLGNGKIMLLENLNFLAEESLLENNVDTLMVKTLSKCDYFVNDSLSSCLTHTTSVTALPKILDSYAGFALEKELNAVKQLSQKNDAKKVFILGGAKPSESISIAEKALENNSIILSAGVFGELVLLAQDHEVGEKSHWLKQNFSQELSRLKTLVKSNGERLFAPIDLAFEDSEGFRVEASVEEVARSKHLAFDVGSKTVKAYSESLTDAETILIKGPLGSIEKTAFQLGTQLILKSIQSSNSFTVVCGEETMQAIEQNKLSYKKFSFISNASSAFTRAFCNKPLPGIIALGGNI